MKFEVSRLVPYRGDISGERQRGCMREPPGLVGRDPFIGDARPKLSDLNEFLLDLNEFLNDPMTPVMEALAA